MNINQQIYNAYLEVKEEFPFDNYMESYLNKYQAIGSEILKKHDLSSNILSIGSGPCDFEAILSNLGYNVVAVDDLNDQWHKIGSNRERIKKFAEKRDVNLLVKPLELLELNEDFDLVLILDVIEHLHNSPREFLNKAISLLKSDGGLLIETPNLATLANRLKVLCGKSNYVDINFFYWNIGSFRGHIREYEKAELINILTNQDITELEIKMLSVMTESLIVENKKKNKGNTLIKIYKLFLDIYPNFRDTILVYGKKPHDWSPSEYNLTNLKKYYGHLHDYNLDNLTDEELFDLLMEG